MVIVNAGLTSSHAADLLHCGDFKKLTKKQVWLYAQYSPT